MADPVAAPGPTGDEAWLLVPTDEIGAGGVVRVAAGDGSSHEVRLVPGKPTRRPPTAQHRP